MEVLFTPCLKSLLSNLPFIVKITESLVAKKLYNLLDNSFALDPFQPGFRPGYGIEIALVTLVNNLCESTILVNISWKLIKIDDQDWEKEYRLQSP